jgi:hypothetical protein
VSAGAIGSAAEDQFAADLSFYATRHFDVIEARLLHSLNFRNGRKADIPQPRLGSTGRYRRDEQPWCAYLSLLLSGGFVDLNYLFHRQQVERTRSEMAEHEAARAAHEELANRYEEQIESLTGDEYWFPKEE